MVWYFVVWIVLGLVVRWFGWLVALWFSWVWGFPMQRWLFWVGFCGFGLGAVGGAFGFVGRD